MAFIFTDEELRSGSKTVLNGPTTISTLTQVGNQNADAQADALKDDNTNAVFYLNYQNIVRQYHMELHSLNGTIKTDYQDQTLVDSAKGIPGNLHFPTVPPPWPNFNPKLLDANLGNPTSFDSSNEVNATSDANAAITTLLSGYSDGGTSDTLLTAWSGGDLEVTTGGFSAGQRVVVGFDTLALITGTAVPPGPPGPLVPAQLLTVTVLAGASSASMGATVVAGHSGWTNAERSGGGTTSPSILAYFENIAATAIGVWNSTLALQLSALNANDATSPEDTQIAQARLDVSAAQGSIVSWQVSAFPYADGPIGTVQAAITLRTGTQIPNRASEINTALGTVSQNSDGSFTGSGEYLNYFKWVNQRISRSGGTLTKYYGFSLTISYVNNTTVNKQDQLDDYEDHMVVHGFANDANGTNVIQLAAVTGYSNGDTLSIVDESVLATLVVTILGITGNNVTVSAPVSGFTANNSARAVKVI